MARRSKSATSRVRIDAPTLRDGPEFLEAVRRSQRLHRAWVSPPASPVDFARFVARSKMPNRRTFLVRVRETRELAGMVSLGEILFGISQSCNMGYYAFEPWARNGFMSEAIGLVLDFAFEELGLHRVEANVQPRNVRSLRLVRRLGFRREGYSPKYIQIAGLFRDHVRTAILAEEWKKRRARSAKVEA